MEARFNYVKAAPGVFKTMLDQGLYLRECGLEKSLLNLICLRGSQINGCAYCLDMHWKDLRAGERTSSGCIHWMPGANVRFTPIVNAPL